MTFGERLEKCIKDSNFTQKELADRIGITPVRLNYWVKDKRQPDVYFIKELAGALGVSADYLIGNDHHESTPVLSPAALALASIYDSLDDHGKCMLDTVAKLESERMEEKPLPKGLVRMSDLPLYPIKYLGDALCDGTIETKYAAKQELRELRESSQVDPVPEHE